MEGEERSLWERIRLGAIFRLLWLISTALAFTVRTRVEGHDKVERLVADGEGGLILPWHGVSMLPIYRYRNRGFYSMVSVSRDGELQNKLLTSRGFKTIRGSSGRHGIRALLESVRCIKEGNIMALTPDGPKGPPKKVQPGPVYLARKSGCPVLPVGVACAPCKRLSSWDSHMIPMPFARAVIAFGDPLRIEPDESDEQAAARIENAIESADRRAEELLGERSRPESIGAFILYNLVLLILSPAILLYILYRIVGSGKSRASWTQQIGGARIPDDTRHSDRIWIHAVSVGESVASAQVVTELKKALPDVAVLVSTTTETGQDMAHKAVKDADGFLYYPFDLLPCVARSLSAVGPVVFASTDTEIWPNFRYLARKMGVRSAVINGTLSDRTVARASKVLWLARWTLANIDLFCMQSQADADRVIALGADPSSVLVTGNCKADQSVAPMSEAEKDQWRARLKLPVGARVLVAGSTNPGEDGPVMDALAVAREAHPDLRLVVAPRQIERAEEIRAMARDRGLSCGRRSDPGSLTGSEDVLLLDTFGELALVYGIADVAFVGGSLIPRGCHSILQPIAQGKPVFFGPHTFKAKDLVAQAKTAGVGFEIRSGEELGRGVLRMLSDTALLEDIRRRCEAMMAANLGASQRTAAALVGLYKDAIGQSKHEPSLS